MTVVRTCLFARMFASLLAVLLVAGCAGPVRDTVVKRSTVAPTAAPEMAETPLGAQAESGGPAGCRTRGDPGVGSAGRRARGNTGAEAAPRHMGRSKPAAACSRRPSMPS